MIRVAAGAEGHRGPTFGHFLFQLLGRLYEHLEPIRIRQLALHAGVIQVQVVERYRLEAG